MCFYVCVSVCVCVCISTVNFVCVYVCVSVCVSMLVCVCMSFGGVCVHEGVLLRRRSSSLWHPHLSSTLWVTRYFPWIPTVLTEFKFVANSGHVNLLTTVYFFSRKQCFFLQNLHRKIKFTQSFQN